MKLVVSGFKKFYQIPQDNPLKSGLRRRFIRIYKLKDINRGKKLLSYARVAAPYHSKD